MTDEPKPASKLDPDEQLEALGRDVEAGSLSPREAFEKTSRIAQLISYDLIDKLRFWEKETIKLSDEEITLRLSHLARSVDALRGAYLTFSDVDF